MDPNSATHEDLPLSQDTFTMLWDHLQNGAADGYVLQDPIQVNFDDYNLGDGGSNIIQQNQVELQVEQLQMEPQFPILPGMPTPGMPTLNSQSSFLAELNQALPPQFGNDTTSAGSAIMPSSTGYQSATDATTPPPCGAAFSPPPCQVLNHAVAPPQQVLPTNIVYPGEYDFQINLGQPTSQAAKSISWTYSPLLQKLFVDRDKSCPIQFKTTGPPPPNCYIRVLPIFKQAENLAENVTRCPNHLGPLGELSAHHLVMCSDPHTLYDTDDRTGRCSLRVPYTAPPVGTEFSKYLFTFKCFISCVGGLNRRKIQLVITLETETGHVLGRQVLDARVCACPGRDRKGEEKQFEKAKTPQKKPLKRGASKVTTTVGLTSFTKKRKVDDEVFHMVIHGREKYELLMKFKESLDLMDYVTPSQISQYRQQQLQINQQYQLPNGLPNLPRVSSIHSSPPSTSQGNTGATPPPSLHRTHTYPAQPQQLQNNLQQHPNNLQQPPNNLQQQHPQSHSHLPQTQQQQQQQLNNHDGQLHPQANHQPQPPQMTQLRHVSFSDQPQQHFANHQEAYHIPTTSTNNLQQHHVPDRRSGRAKDEADGPNMGMEVDAQPASQGFGLPTPTPCSTANNNHDPSVYGWLSMRGFKQYIDIFHRKGVHTVDQLDNIHMEDLANLPQAERESLWKSILDLRGKLHLDNGPVPSMHRTSSSTSTASVHSSGSLSGSQGQVYRATRFTLKQTLSFKVEKEDNGYDQAGV